MSGELFDRIPRILDFTEPILGVRAEKDLGWPCHAFRVTVPVRPGQTLNIFEGTVLRLLEDARCDEVELADITGLDCDLVTLICNRLRDRQLITKHNELTNTGAQFLGKELECEAAYEARFIFRDLVSGAIIPFLLTDDLRYEPVKEWKGSYARIQQSNGKNVSLRLLRPDYGIAMQPPTAAEVFRAARLHADQVRQYFALRGRVVRAPKLLAWQKIVVGPSPECVYLRCKAVILADEDDYRIGHPFGFGFSSSFFQAFETLRGIQGEAQDLVGNLRESSITVRPAVVQGDQAAEKVASDIRVEFNSDVVGYGDIYENLILAEKWFQVSRKAPRNSDEEAQFDYFAMTTLHSLAKVMETTLWHVATIFRESICEFALVGHNRSFQENGDLLESLASRIGFHTDRIGRFLKVPAGRIRALREDGIPDLQALVAITLASASENAEHPLHRIVDRFPGWISFLSSMKQFRDAGLHGQTRKAGISRLYDLRNKTYRSIKILIPALAGEGLAQTPRGPRTDLDADHDGRRRALARLEAVFGVSLRSDFSRDACERLIQVERAVAAMPDQVEACIATQVVNDLAAVVQFTTGARVVPPAGGLGEEKKWLALAHERAGLAGLLIDIDQPLPKCLTTVNSYRLRAALQGQSPTLGANILALLLLMPLESLNRLARASPSFLHLVARLIDLRGHGNQPVLMSPDEVKRLRDESYSICVALMEC